MRDEGTGHVSHALCGPCMSGGDADQVQHGTAAGSRARGTPQYILDKVVTILCLSFPSTRQRMVTCSSKVYKGVPLALRLAVSRCASSASPLPQLT